MENSQARSALIAEIMQAHQDGNCELAAALSAKYQRKFGQKP